MQGIAHRADQGSEKHLTAEFAEGSLTMQSQAHREIPVKLPSAKQLAEKLISEPSALKGGLYVGH